MFSIVVYSSSPSSSRNNPSVNSALPEKYIVSGSLPSISINADLFPLLNGLNEFNYKISELKVVVISNSYVTILSAYN